MGFWGDLGKGLVNHMQNDLEERKKALDASVMEIIDRLNVFLAIFYLYCYKYTLS